MNKTQINIGIISDTHGPVPAKVHQIFKGVNRIIHAGDIGDTFVIPELESIAPVTAVFGNTDGNTFSSRLREYERLKIGGYTIDVFHIPWHFPQTTDTADKLIRISGHTHTPRIHRENGVLYINPGSATKPRKVLKPSVALLTLEDGKLPEAEIVFID